MWAVPPDKPAFACRALVEIFYRTVVRTSYLGDGLVWYIPAQLTHMQGKALCIVRVLCQPVKMFYVHAVAPRTTNTPALKLQADSPSGHRESAYSQDLLVVPPGIGVHSANRRLFFRRLSGMTRAYRSANTPINFDVVVKPGKAKSARIDVGFFMALA